MMCSEEKYVQLLQPIRDIAANFNIDIAKELELYLDELSEITFNFGGDASSLNFAQAALLVQGSTAVYSRKVEYLHTLVYQALQHVANQNHQQDKSNRTKSSKKQDDDDDDDDELSYFLSLASSDSFLSSNTTAVDASLVINLEEDDNDNEDGLYRHGNRALGMLRPPPALLALEDGTIHQPTNPSRNNSSNKDSRAAAALKGDGECGLYRLALCTIHCSGALLLDARDGDYLDIHLQRCDNNNNGESSRPDMTLLSPSDIQGREHYYVGGLGVELVDNIDDGGGYDDYYGDEQLAEGEYVAHNRNEVTEEEEEEEEEEDVFDPYKPLDPNDNGISSSKSTVMIKPFRKLVRLPKAPRPPPGRSDLFRTTFIFPQSTLAAALTDDLLMLPFPSSAAGNSLLFLEFSYVVQKLGNKRKGGETNNNSKSNDIIGAAFTIEEATHGQYIDAVEDDVYDDGNGDGGYDADDLHANGVNTTNIIDDMEYHQLTPINHNISTTTTPSSGRLGSGVSLTYEELCRAHVEAFLQAAAAAQVQTELATRVSTWRSRMGPVLEEEDARAEFDIHMYGQAIFDRLSSSSAKLSSNSNSSSIRAAEAKQGDVVLFKDVAPSTDKKWEVSRAFSSMLQLVNAGNIGITRLDTGEDEDRGVVGGFILEMLGAIPTS